jgi:hypothetical protein
MTPDLQELEVIQKYSQRFSPTFSLEIRSVPDRAIRIKNSNSTFTNWFRSKNNNYEFLFEKIPGVDGQTGWREVTRAQLLILLKNSGKQSLSR